MKKVLLILLSMALVFSMAGGVFGATTQYSETISGDGENPETDLGGSSEARVSYSIHNTYVVKVPAVFTFSEVVENGEARYTAGSSIYAKITTIGPNEYLNVTMTSKNGHQSSNPADVEKWFLKPSTLGDDVTDTSQMYEYYVKMSDSSSDHIASIGPGSSSPLKSGGIALSIPSGSTMEYIKHIHMRIANVPTAAAEYTDTITFRVTIGE